MASLIVQMVTNQPAMLKTWVQSLGWEAPWRRERLPTPVFWPREFHGLYSPWGRKELDMTEQIFTFYRCISMHSTFPKEEASVNSPSVIHLGLGDKQFLGYFLRWCPVSSKLTTSSISSVQSFSRVRVFMSPMNCSTPGLLVHHQLLT